jgi:ABC-type Zn2+ transport system substrate-binding protein/surface adhesin
MADHEHEHPHDHEHEHDHEHGTETISFAAFVLSLAHTAAVHFGDIPDPMSGQMSEANLPAAQQMIDILSLLDAKTRGNLSAEERQLLEQILYELRLRFVEASKPQSRIITP